MEGIKADELAVVGLSVATYGTKIASIIHNFSLITPSLPRKFAVTATLLDSSLTTLKQLIALFAPLKNTGSESEIVKTDHVFSKEGLEYVQLLIQEIASFLVKIEPIVEEACLGRQERRKLEKQKSKGRVKQVEKPTDLVNLSLDEQSFTEKVEKANWKWVLDDVWEYMPRLYQLQVLSLLVFHVGTVAKLSKDVSSGKVDVQSIINCNTRIVHTARTAGIKLPGKSGGRYGARSSFSDSDSSDSDSDLSDSSLDSFSSRNWRKKKSKRRFTPILPPPPPPPLQNRAPSVPLLPSDPPVNCSSQALPEPKAAPLLSTEGSKPANANGTANPPAYSEDSVATSTAKTSSSDNLPSAVTKEAVYPDEKKPEKEEKEEKTQVQDLHVITYDDPRLFGPKSNSLGSRLKNLFRSKESLAREIQRVSDDTEHQLTAFVCQKTLVRPMPHSAFHSLEATHLKTILAHNNWYETYKTFDATERITLHSLLHPPGQARERELVSLKIVQENRFNAWLHTNLNIIRHYSWDREAYLGRSILVICREKLVNGKPIQDFYSHPNPPPLSRPPRGLGRIPPPPPPPPPPGPSSKPTRYPESLGGPMPFHGQASIVSDLDGPRPKLTHHPDIGVIPSAGTRLPPSGPRSASIRYMDTTPPPDETECKLILTTYREFTVRICGPITPATPRNWSRVIISQESSERQAIEKRIQQFESSGLSVVESKISLSEQQSGQVTRIMDDIVTNDRDPRFQWCWVELSMYDEHGTRVNHCNQPPMIAGTAATRGTQMYLIAKRTLRPQYRPADVYHSLLRGEGVPVAPIGVRPAPGAALPPPFSRPGPPVMPPPPIGGGPPIYIPKGKSRRRFSSRDSDSDTDYSSDSDTDFTLKRIRRLARKPARKRFSYNSDSDSNSDSESEDEEEDDVKLNIDLKKGDSIVQKLLDMWTSTGSEKGKAKAV